MNGLAVAASSTQAKQIEWNEQWSLFDDQERFLFEDWIQPFGMDVFEGKNVLECGCGGGQHTAWMAERAQSVTAVDLNTTDLARKRNASAGNVEFVEADIARMDLGRKFDVCISIGVVHHTDDPAQTVANIKRHLAPGGVLILWVYASEGNFLMRTFVEPARKLFLAGRSRRFVLALSRAITALVYLPVYSLYLLPLSKLPYYEYFGNFRKLSFERNVLNVFDKLNAPQTRFIRRDEAEQFVADLAQAIVLPYKGVSYSASGVKNG